MRSVEENSERGREASGVALVISGEMDGLSSLGITDGVTLGALQLWGQRSAREDSLMAI